MREKTKLATLLVLTVLGTTGLFFSPAAASEQPAPAAVAPQPTEPVVVRIHVRDTEHLNAVAGELDIWETHPNELYVVARVTPEQHQWLEGLGYRLEIDGDKTADIRAAAIGPLDPRFHYFDDYLTNANGLYIKDTLQSINVAHPDLTELIDIGDAWLANQQDEHHRDIWVMRITNEDAAYGPIESKPAFFLFGTIHAREVVIPELATRYIKYLTEGFGGAGGYGVDPDVTWLVNHNVVHVLVMQNPDGHWVNEQDTSAFRRKNSNDSNLCANPANAGVDLNRNSSFLWGCCGGSSVDPCSPTYRGPAPASEPETQAFQAYFASVMQDQNGPNGDDEIPPAAPDDTTGIFISLHAYQDEIYWPWGFDDFDPSPNHAQLETIGHKFAYYNNYTPAGTIFYDVDGATDDWTYGKFGIASYTFEVGPTTGTCRGFFPPFGCIDAVDGMPRNFWAENLPVLLYAHKIAATPYMTAYGPDADNVVALPAFATPGLVVQLSARVADHRYVGDPLRPMAAAEYFIDAPGTDGTGTAMMPSDGTFDTTSEQVLTSINTTGLSSGRHYVLVHGQNDAGDWGPFTAAFLTIAVPGDFDFDGTVNLADHAVFAACLSGPDVTTPPPGCSPAQFDVADLDNDDDVDTNDFAAFQSLIGQ